MVAVAVPIVFSRSFPRSSKQACGMAALDFQSPTSRFDCLLACSYRLTGYGGVTGNAGCVHCTFGQEGNRNS